MAAARARRLVDLRGGVTVVHLNIASGYCTYIAQGEAGPQVKAIPLAARDAAL